MAAEPPIFERLTRLETDNTNIKDDLKEIKDSIKGLTKVIWAGFSLLFIGFLTALGILVSQGGIH